MKFFWYAILQFFVQLQFSEGCTDLFQYYNDFKGLYGQVVLHNVPLQPSIRFELHLSVAAAVDRNNVGTLTLLNTNVASDLQNGHDLIYKYYPPITNPRPMAIGIFLNDQQLCSGPPARGGYISTLKLYNTYTLGGFPSIFAPIYHPSAVNRPQPPPTQAPIYVEPPTQPPVYVKQTTTQAPIYTETTTQLPVIHTKPPPINIPDRISSLQYTKIEEICGNRVLKTNFVSLIIGGKEAQKNEFPWLAAFYYKKDGFICGGTLVSAKIVVTAAHCVQNKGKMEIKRASESTFYLGKYNLNALNEPGYVDAAVDRFIVHPDWNPSNEAYHGDITLAILSRTIEFADNIVPLCLWPQSHSHSDLVGQRGLIAGWGITETGTTSDKPMFLSLPVVDDVECLRSRPVFSRITSNSTFCVGDKQGSSPCQGDSGGAFATSFNNRYYLRGVVSAGAIKSDYTCDNKEYVIFTDVAQYTQWINYHISYFG